MDGHRPHNVGRPRQRRMELDGPNPVPSVEVFQASQRRRDLKTRSWRQTWRGLAMRRSLPKASPATTSTTAQGRQQQGRRTLGEDCQRRHVLRTKARGYRSHGKRNMCPLRAEARNGVSPLVGMCRQQEGVAQGHGKHQTMDSKSKGRARTGNLLLDARRDTKELAIWHNPARRRSRMTSKGGARRRKARRQRPMGTPRPAKGGRGG